MRRIVLDGYNVILRSPAFAPDERRDLEAARNKLENLLSWAVGSFGDVRFIIIYDGDHVPGRARRRTTGARDAEGASRIEVRFSIPPQKADDLIKTLVDEWSEDDDEITVVTSDLEIASHARGAGATVVFSDLFAASLFPERAEAQLRDVMKQVRGGKGAGARGGKAAGRRRKGATPPSSPTADGSDAETKPGRVSEKEADEWIRLFEEQRKNEELH